MNGTTKWEYSTYRDMQNRIKLLEMDNELMKSQMLSYSQDIRQAFMEMAERIDKMETKLTHLIQFEKSHATNIMFPMFHIPNVENPEGLEHVNPLDAMSCVETVMESCTELRQTILADEGKKISDAVLKSLDNIQNKRSIESDSNPSTSPLVQRNVALEADGRRRYDCSVCGKTFSQSSGLSRHHKIHIRRQQDIQNGIHSDRFTKPKKFFCSYPGCQSSFTSRSGMTKHTRNFHRGNRAVSSGARMINMMKSCSQQVASAPKISHVQPSSTSNSRLSAVNGAYRLSDGVKMSQNHPASRNDPNPSDEDEDLDEPEFTPLVPLSVRA